MTQDDMANVLALIIVVVLGVVVYSLISGHESVYWKDQDND